MKTNYLILMIYFSFSVINITHTFKSTFRVCDDDSMLTRCSYSVFQLREILNDKQKYLLDYLIVTCPSDSFTNRTLKELKSFENRCRQETIDLPKLITHHSTFWMIIESTPHWPIINGSMGFFRDYDSQLFWDHGTTLLGFKGFDIESIIELKSSSKLEIRGSFNIYARNRLVKTCEDFLNFNTSGFIFDTKEDSESIPMIKLFRPESKHPVCPLFFRHARIEYLEIDYMIKSFYFESMLTFGKSCSSNLDSEILSLRLDRIYGIDLDSRLLNPDVFASIKTLELEGHINSIRTDVFKSLRNLNWLSFCATHFVRVIRAQGIEWIRSINSDLNVDILNETAMMQHKNRAVLVEIRGDREFRSNLKATLFFLLVLRLSV